MSLYNAIHGFNPLTAMILGLIDDAPAFPRYRDCYMARRDGELCVAVYTRAGGGNRESYEEEIECVQAHPQYVGDFDDDFDCTYATFWFRVSDAKRALAEEYLDPDAKAPGEKMLGLIQRMQSTPSDKWDADPELSRAMAVVAPILGQIKASMEKPQ